MNHPSTSELAQSSRRVALVTGGTGFIGGHLVRHLQDAGWEVHLLVRPLAEGGRAEMAGVTVHPYLGSVNEVSVALKVSRPEVVFHLASLFLVQHTPAQVEPLIASNVLFGAQLLEAMAGIGVRKLVNAGTSWQYLHSLTYRPANLYAATKQAFEDIAAYYIDTGALRVVTLSLFDSYGPQDTRRKLMRLLLECLRTDDALQVSPGEQVLDLVHVDDICRAFLQAAELLANPEHAAMSTYAVSSGERVSLRGLVVVIERVAGRRLPVLFGARPYREREVMGLWHGPALPGWKPQITLEEGIRRLLREVSA